jgi:hypothetical protein
MSSGDFIGSSDGDQKSRQLRPAIFVVALAADIMPSKLSSLVCPPQQAYMFNQPDPGLAKILCRSLTVIPTHGVEVASVPSR